MSRKTILIIVVVAVVLFAGAGAAVAGFFMYREYEEANNLAQAEQYRDEGNFGMASNYYKMYLSRNREDTEILRDYAEMNEKILAGRRMALTTAANAYNQINNIQPDPELQDKIIELYEKLRSWADVEYYANFFLSDRPDSDELEYKAALAIDNQGRTADARAAYEALIAKGTDNPQIYANLAGVLIRQNYPEEAARVIATMEETLSDNPITYVRIGEYNTELGNLSLAADYADKALALDPESTDALFFKAQLELMQNKPESAISFARKALEHDPDNVRTKLLVAVAQNYLGDHAAAVETLEAIDDLDAVDNPEVLIALAESQISENRLADVDETINKYRRAYPEMRLTLDYLEGRKALASGNASQAVTELTNVVELNPNFASAQYYLAVALLQSQQRDRGRVTLENYIQSHPSDQQAKRLFEQEFGGPQDVASASQRLEVLLNTSTSPEELFAGIRPILNAAVEDADARASNPLVIQALKKIVELDPSFERAHQSLIFYNAERGNAAEARNALEHALASGIPQERLLMATAAVELAEGSDESARQHFATALARQDFTVDKAIAWANLFANQGDLEQGLNVLTQSVDKNIGDAAAIIDLEKPLLLARHDQLDRAIDTLQALSDKYMDTPSAQERLTDLKLQFAQTLLRLDDAKRIEQAEVLLSQVSTADPNNPSVSLIRAENLLRQTPPRVDEAIALLDRVLVLDKNNVRALVALARIYGDQGNIELALDYGRRASNVAVGNLEAQLLVAQLQYSLQRYRECQETLVSLLATHPDSTRAMELLAQSYIATRNPNMARMTLDDMVAAAGTDEEILARANALRSRLLLDEGRRLDEAERLLREQLETDPDNTALLMDLASAIAGQGRIDEAEQLLTEYAEQHNDRPDGWYLLGRFYLNRNEPALISKATSALTRARLVDPNHVPSLRAQIEAQARQGKPVETLQLAERYLESRPNDDQIWYRKGAVLYQLERMDEAFEAVDRAIELNEQPDYLYLRASIHLAKKRYKEALTDLQRVELEGVTSANFDMALAEAYLGVGEAELARQHYDSARQKSRPGDTISPERIERFEKQIEEMPAA